MATPRQPTVPRALLQFNFALPAGGRANPVCQALTKASSGRVSVLRPRALQRRGLSCETAPTKGGDLHPGRGGVASPRSARPSHSGISCSCGDSRNPGQQHVPEETEELQIPGRMGRKNPTHVFGVCMIGSGTLDTAAVSPWSRGPGPPQQMGACSSRACMTFAPIGAPPDSRSPADSVDPPVHACMPDDACLVLHKACVRFVTHACNIHACIPTARSSMHACRQAFRQLGHPCMRAVRHSCKPHSCMHSDSSNVQFSR